MLVGARMQPMNDTSGSTPLAQSSSKPSAGLAAVVGLAGSPIPPGVPSPNSVPSPITELNSAAGTSAVLWKFAN